MRFPNDARRSIIRIMRKGGKCAHRSPRIYAAVQATCSFDLLLRSSKSLRVVRQLWNPA